MNEICLMTTYAHAALVHLDCQLLLEIKVSCNVCTMCVLQVPCHIAEILEGIKFYRLGPK